MSDQSKDDIISEICDEYRVAKMMGRDPDIQEYLRRCPPEYIQELKEDIEDWEWLVGWKYEGPAEEISQDRLESLIEKIQPQLDVIDRENQAGGVRWQNLGKIIEFPALKVASKTERSDDEILRKAAQSRDGKISEYGDTQLLSDSRGVVYTDTSSGHFCVQLTGPPEKTAGIRLALCEKKPDGSLRTCMEGETNKQGIADFGRIDDISKPQYEQVYTLCIESVADPGSAD